MTVYDQYATRSERECRASISGNCLQLTHGFTLCREGECDGEVLQQMAEAAVANAAPPRRNRRKARRGSPRKDRVMAPGDAGNDCIRPASHAGTTGTGETDAIVPEPVHGTYGSYQRELLHGEPCDRCKKAAADYHRFWRQRKGPAQAHERWLNDTRKLALERMAKNYPVLFESALAEARREVPDPALDEAAR